jgi:hypothetical protein
MPRSRPMTGRWVIFPRGHDEGARIARERDGCHGTAEGAQVDPFEEIGYNTQQHRDVQKSKRRIHASTIGKMVEYIVARSQTERSCVRRDAANEL